MLFVQTASVAADEMGTRLEEAAVPSVLMGPVVFVQIASVFEDEAMLDRMPVPKLVPNRLELLVQIASVVGEGMKLVVPPVPMPTPVPREVVVSSAVAVLELEDVELLLAVLENVEAEIPLMPVPPAHGAVGVGKLLPELVLLVNNGSDGCEEESEDGLPPVVNGTELELVGMYPGPVITVTTEELTSQIEQTSLSHAAVSLSTRYLEVPDGSGADVGLTWGNSPLVEEVCVFEISLQAALSTSL